MAGIFVSEGKLIIQTSRVRDIGESIVSLLGKPEDYHEFTGVQVTITYTAKEQVEFITWFSNLSRPIGSFEAFKALYLFFRNESFVIQDEEAFFVMNDLYNSVPGRTGSAYGLGMLVGGSGGGYFANSGGLKIEFSNKRSLVFIQAGEFAGRMIGRKGQNAKAIGAFLSLVRETRVIVKG